MTAAGGIGWIKTRPAVLQQLDPLSTDAEFVWHRLRLYCGAVGNDGKLAKRLLHVGVARKISEKRAVAALAELVDAGLVRDRGEAWEFVGWLDEQPAAADWNDPVRRLVWQRRAALGKDHDLRRRIQQRDHNECQYCGVRVRWTDKRGPTGGTYDHVDPDGGNEYWNVVVACRRCNGRKGHRTPAQWLEADPENAHPLRDDPYRGLKSDSNPESTPSGVGTKSGGKFPSRARATAERVESEPSRTQLHGTPRTGRRKAAG